MFGRKSSLLALSSFVVLNLPALAGAAPSFATGAPAPWVLVAPLDQPAPTAPAGVSMMVLDDHQTRVTNRSVERYVRHVHLVASQKDLEDRSQIQIEFEPSYQTLTIHHIRIHRADTVTNGLRPSDIRVLHREQELEQRIFNGTVEAVAILNDVRVGDTIDYAYTITGDNPVMAGRFNDIIDLEPRTFAKRLRARLLWPPNRNLHMRRHNTDLSPTIVKGEAVEYVWERRDVRPLDYEDRLPDWHLPGAWVEISEFETWGDLVAWGLPLYGARGARSPELQAKIDAIARASTSTESRLLAALRFVQDEIRYLGIEMGEYSHQPTAPDIVLARRFGDCKDKAWLLATMLQALGIDAAPALVDTEFGQILDSRQPSPYAFDHVIVQARLKDKTYWLDGTRTLQRGGLAQFYNPPFAKALVLRPETTALEDIPSTALKSPTTFTTERYVVTSPSAPVALTVKTVYTGEAADDIRYDVSRTSTEKLGRQYLNFYAEDNPQIEVSVPLTIDDNESTNTVTVIEQYSIPGFWKDSVHLVAASSMVDDVQKPTVSRRSMPLRVTYPLHIRHRIEVEMPEPADPDQDSLSYRDAAIEFEMTEEWAGRRLVLDYSLRTMRDHVAAGDVAKHLVTLDNIMDSLGYDVPLHPSRAMLATRDGLLVLFSVASLGAVGFVVVALVKKRRRAIRLARFAPRPGEGPSTAIPVADTDAMRQHLAPQSCGCGRSYDLQPSSVREEHFAYDGHRLTVLSVHCHACKTAREVYFKVGAISL